MHLVIMAEILLRSLNNHGRIWDTPTGYFANEKGFWLRVESKINAKNRRIRANTDHTRTWRKIDRWTGFKRGWQRFHRKKGERIKENAAFVPRKKTFFGGRRQKGQEEEQKDQEEEQKDQEEEQKDQEEEQKDQEKEQAKEERRRSEEKRESSRGKRWKKCRKRGEEWGSRGGKT